MELSTDIIILLKAPTIGEGVTPIRVSAIPPAILQLAPGTDVRAEVLGRMVNGQTLMRVAGELLTMELPDTVTTGSSLRMTFLGREPRPTFTLSLQQNSPTPVAISQTGRWLGQVVQGAVGSSPRPEQLSRPTPLMDGPPLDTTRLAASLREALSTSGIFYESHLAEWAAGERDLASIMKEPQATLSRQADEAPAATPPGSERTPGTPTPAADRPQTASSAASPQGGTAVPQPAGRESNEIMPAAAAAGGSTAPDEAAPTGSAPTTPRPDQGAPPAAAGRTVEAAPGGSPQPALSPAGTPPEAPRPGPGAAQAPATAPGGRGETATGAEPLPQAAGQAETPAAATPPRPAAAPSAPTPPGPAAPSHSPPSPPPTGPEQPAASSASRGEPLPASSDHFDTGATATVSRKQPEPPHQTGRSQPLGQQEQAAKESTGIQPDPHLERGSRDPAIASQGQRPEVADPRAAPVIREQLATLNSGIVTWSGEAWKGQPLEWQVEDREARHRDSSEGRWQSELRVDLPNLGRIVSSLKVRGREIHVSFTADDGATTGLMQQEALHLEERLAAAGLNLANLVIRHGKKE